MSDAPALDQTRFRRGALIYPQPVAFSFGRILRATPPQERIDATLKGAEVLCRYVAALALASLRCRDDESAWPALEPFDGNLSFGHFLAMIQRIAPVEGHPLSAYLSPFRSKGKGRNRTRGKADEAMVALLELRNQLGHDLASLQKARAITVLRNDDPEGALLNAAGAMEGLLSLPLFVLDSFTLENRVPTAQQLLFMGESPDPPPHRVQLTEPLDTGRPYVAIRDKVIPLPPMVIFTIVEAQTAYRLAFLDAVEAERLRFKTLETNVLHKAEEETAELQSVFDGKTHVAEPAVVYGGGSLTERWHAERKAREEQHRRAEGLPPWDRFSSKSLEWFATRLAPADRGTPRERITAILLDGRDSGLTPEEVRQLTLLFGDAQEVRSILSRDLSDFRARGQGEARWDERIVGSDNVLDTLVVAVDFFMRHVGVDAHEASDLSRTEGSADYVAMREALVNQFIHQDYSDPTAPAQIELSPDRAMFFNTGYSLVAEDQLPEGGRSQARNPLIARALRLIGFAELAGSGLRALQHVWRKARRRPPVFESDREANTFSLVLDWREVPNAYDDVWNERLGVHLDVHQAEILNLGTDPSGITVQQAALGVGLGLAEAGEALRYLVRQVLMEERGGRYFLKDHLREALSE